MIDFRHHKVDIAIEEKAAEKPQPPQEENNYWRTLLKAFLQPTMILLLAAAAVRHTGDKKSLIHVHGCLRLEMPYDIS